MFRNDLIKTAMGQETLSAIAYRSGVSVDTVARARDGENLSIKSLTAIAKALGLDVRDLFTCTENEGAPKPDSLPLQN